MKLNSVRGAPDAKRLVRGDTARCEVHGFRWQREGVVVPLENTEVARHTLQHRIGGTLVAQAYRAPAEFRSASDLVHAAEGTREQLAAKADAENRLVFCLEVAGKFEQGWNVGKRFIIERILAAAQG